MQTLNRSFPSMLPVANRLLAALLLILSTLFLMPAAKAIILGEVVVNSSLNQPLRASIALSDLQDIILEDMVIEIGDEEQYENVGLQKTALLTNLELDVVETGNGAIIEITSEDLINEPFINLILVLEWRGGSIVREFTLLLDLPGRNRASVIEAPVSTGLAGGAASNGTGVRNIPGPGGTYTVQRGDNLWNIAGQMLPDGSVSVQQMMIALQRENESAFVNNNINQIIAGRVLRIPTLSAVQLIEQEAAIAQVNAQSQDLPLQLFAMPGDGGGGNSIGQDELTLLSGDHEAGPSAGSSDLEATIAALTNELMLSEENLDRARIENQELTSRLSSLQEEIALLQTIIEIEDEQLAQYQAELAAQAEAAASIAAAAQTTNSIINTQVPQQPNGLVGSILDTLQSSLLSITSVLVLVLLVLAFLVLRRRRAEAEGNAEFSFDEFEDEDRYDQPLARVGVGESATSVREIEESLGEEDEQDEDEQALDEDDEELLVLDDEAQDEEDPDQFAAEIEEELDEPDEEGLFEATVIDDELDEESEADNDDAETESLEVFEYRRPGTAESPDQETSEVEEDQDTDLSDEDIESFEYTSEDQDEIDDKDEVDEELSDDEDDIEDSFELDDVSFEDTMVPTDEEEDGYESENSDSKGDENSTKLDLAVAYEAMGDVDGAIEILDEVIAEGSEDQVEHARSLKAQWQDS